MFGAAVAEDEKGRAGRMTIEVVFTEPGSLGLGFEAANPREPPKIKEVKAGTQAVQHWQLTVGMKLVAVGGTSCEGMRRTYSMQTCCGDERP